MKKAFYHCVWEGCKSCGGKGNFMIESTPGENQTNAAYQVAHNAAIEDSGRNLPIIITFSRVE